MSTGNAFRAFQRQAGSNCRMVCAEIPPFHDSDMRPRELCVIHRGYFLNYTERCDIRTCGPKEAFFALKRGCLVNPTHVCLSLKDSTVGAVPQPTRTNSSPPEALLILSFICQDPPLHTLHTHTHTCTYTTHPASASPVNDSES